MNVRLRYAGLMRCVHTQGSCCLGTGCMAWRFSDPPKTEPANSDPLSLIQEREGYCGLAGKPEIPR